MFIATVEVSGTTAKAKPSRLIPSGLVGGKVQIQYTDDIWKGLTVTAVFRNGVTKDVLDVKDEVIIPPEVTRTSDRYLLMGLYGVSADGTLIVPTLWTKLGLVHDAANPEGDSSTDASIPTWLQIQQNVTRLRNSTRLVVSLDTATSSASHSSHEIKEHLAAGGWVTAVKDGEKEAPLFSVGDDNVTFSIYEGSTNSWSRYYYPVDGNKKIPMMTMEGGVSKPAISGPIYAVSYVKQTLTSAQKTQARENIDAVSLDEIWASDAFLQLEEKMNGSSCRLTAEAAQLLLSILRAGQYTTDQTHNISALAEALGIEEPTAEYEAESTALLGTAVLNKFVLGRT